MPNQKTVNYTDKARIEKSTFVAKGSKFGKWKRLEGKGGGWLELSSELSGKCRDKKKREDEKERMKWIPLEWERKTRKGDGMKRKGERMKKKDENEKEREDEKEKRGRMRRKREGGWEGKERENEKEREDEKEKRGRMRRKWEGEWKGKEKEWKGERMKVKD